jgi:hypothetical protein
MASDREEARFEKWWRHVTDLGVWPARDKDVARHAWECSTLWPRISPGNQINREYKQFKETL